MRGMETQTGFQWFVEVWPPFAGSCLADGFPRGEKDLTGFLSSGRDGVGVSPLGGFEHHNAWPAKAGKPTSAPLSPARASPTVSPGGRKTGYGRLKPVHQRCEVSQEQQGRKRAMFVGGSDGLRCSVASAFVLFFDRFPTPGLTRFDELAVCPAGFACSRHQRKRRGA